MSYPANVKPHQNFTIRVSAYLPENDVKIQQLLLALAPEDQHIMKIDNCKWKRGTEISVRVHSPVLKVDPEIQEFEWVGKTKILSFDATVNENTALGKLFTIKVDISIVGIIIARLRGNAKVDLAPFAEDAKVIGKPIKTAFASYARADTKLVIGRLSEIERNGVKIFWDRMSLQTGKDWQLQLSNAIKANQAFQLFWSANAKASEYVTWEWKSALQHKGLEGIDPHPLESPSDAPPPEELSSLHFDDKYLYFGRNH